MAAWSPSLSISLITSPAVSDARSSSNNSPSSEPSSSEPRGRLRLVASGMASFTLRTSSTVQPSRSATSLSIGSRSSSAESSLYVWATLRIFSDMCTGTLIVRPLSATALWTACLIHQVAYVEKRKPFFGVELVCCSHEAYVALLDEIPEGQSHPTVLLCDRDDEPQVLLDELGPRRLVALPCPPAEIYLLLVRKKPSATDLPQVPRKRVWGLPIVHPAYRLSCYFESSSLCSLPLSGRWAPPGHLLPAFPA